MFENYLGNYTPKKFFIKDVIKGLPTINESEYVWTNDNLFQLLHNVTSYDVRYLVKYIDLFSELSFLLNEGYIQFKIEPYDVPLVNKPSLYERHCDMSELLDEHQLPLYQEICQCSSYMNEVLMSLTLASKLYNNGVVDIEFNNRNYSIYAKQQGLMIKHGDVSIPFLLRSFEKGLNQFIITPIIQNDKGIMYVLSVTPKYKEYLAKRHEKLKTEKRAFSELKGKYTPSYPQYLGEPLSEHDLVEFNMDGTRMRGYIHDCLSHKKHNYIEYVENLQKSMYPTANNDIQLQQMLGLYRLDVDLTFDEFLFKNADFIVKCFDSKTRSEKHAYYAVKKEDIHTYLSWGQNFELFSSPFKDILEHSRTINPNVMFKKERDSKNTANATYNPLTNVIAFNLDNTFNSTYMEYALNNIHPNDFVATILAHELGHADPRGLHVFGKLYKDVINEINLLSKLIKDNIDAIEYNDVPDIKLIEETIALCQTHVSCLEIYYENVMESEFNAYLYGRDYLNDDNLKRLFQQHSKELYNNYKKGELKPLRNAQQQLYEMKQLLNKL